MEMRTADRTFRRDLIAAVYAGLGPEEELTAGMILKNNGVMREGIQIRKKDTGVSRVIYLDELAARYEAGIPLSTLAEQVCALKDRVEEMTKGKPEVFLNDSTFLERVSFRLISAGRNHEFLLQHPHRQVLDLAMVYCVSVPLGEGVQGTAMIRHEYAERAGVTEEELHEAAVRNAPLIYPPKLCRITDAIDELLTICTGKEAAEPFPQADAVPLYVLSNTSGVYGAAAMLYDGVISGFAAEKNCDLIILPSSVHEVILLPDEGLHRKEHLAQMVLEVNRTEVAAEEVLSDRIYRYDRNSDRLMFA